MRNRWGDLAREPLERVREIRDLVDSPDARVDAYQSLELARLKRVLRAVELRLTGRNAELIPARIWPDLNNLLAQAVGIAQQAASAVQAGTPNFEPTNDSMDRVLQTLAAAPTPPATPKAVADAAARFDEEASEIVARLQSQAEDLEAQVGELRTAAQGAVQAAREEITSTQQELQATIEQSAQSVRELQGRVDTLIDNQQANFSSTLEQQRDEFGGLLDDARAKLSESLESSKTATLAQQTESKSSAAALLAELDSMRKKAERQLTTIGATGLAAGYKLRADQENKSRLSWRFATLAFGLAAVGFLVWAAAHAGSASASWIGVATKSGVAVAFGSLAAYAGRLAGKHHRRAAHYRDRELALASLGTYLESLDEPARGELMAELAPSFFSELHEEHAKDDWPTQTTDLLGQLTQVLAKLPSKS